MERREILTVGEVADLLSVSRQTIWRWRRGGILPAVMIGRSIRFRRSDIDTLLDKMLNDNFDEDWD